MSLPIRPLELYRALADAHAFDSSWPDGDWPRRGGFTPPRLEIALGAVLTQNTRWPNVETALGRLEKMQLNTSEDIRRASREDLEEAVRPAGFYRRKAATIRQLVHLLEEAGERPPERCELLAVRGIGPETADAILLYAFHRSEFVVDAYTRRLLERLGLVGSGDGYDRVRARLEADLPRDVRLYKAFHALVVEHGKHTCRHRPRCAACVLRPRCPAMVVAPASRPRPRRGQ